MHSNFGEKTSMGFPPPFHRRKAHHLHQYSFFLNTHTVSGQDTANAAALHATIKIPLITICLAVILSGYTLLTKVVNPIKIPIPPSRLTIIITVLRSSPPRKYMGKKTAPTKRLTAIPITNSIKISVPLSKG